MKPERLIEDLSLVPLPAWWENPWVLLAVPVASGLAAYLLRQWWLGRRPPAVAVAAPPGPPPHEEFLARLAALRAQQDRWVPHPFAVEVSDILRGYLEARFAFPVRFQTSREFLGAAATDARLSGEQRAALGGFLGGCDRIKFARAEANAAGMLGLIDAAEGFIRQGAGTPSDASGGGRA